MSRREADLSAGIEQCSWRILGREGRLYLCALEHGHDGEHAAVSRGASGEWVPGPRLSLRQMLRDDSPDLVTEIQERGWTLRVIRHGRTFDGEAWRGGGGELVYRVHNLRSALEALEHARGARSMWEILVDSLGRERMVSP